MIPSYNCSFYLESRDTSLHASSSGGNKLCGRMPSLIGEQPAQAIKIKSLEKTKGMVRLRFIAGGRIFAAMRRYLTEEAALNKVSEQCTHIYSHPGHWTACL